MAKPAGAQYRYDLDVEIPATDAAVLVDALDGEPFGLRQHLGAHELRRQLEGLELHVSQTSPTRWPDFEKDIEILSVYLPEYVEGREIAIEPTGRAPKLEGYRIVGHRGETVRVRLDLTWDAESGTVVHGDDDVQDLERRWASLPAWARSALRTKHPALAALK
jgi:hypothetical protein